MPRRFFQLHLSTALILMLAASALLWANVVPEPDSGGMLVWALDYGWPMIYRTEPGSIVSNEPSWLSYKHLLLNLAGAFAILLVIAAICECALRRKRANPQTLSAPIAKT